MVRSNSSKMPKLVKTKRVIENEVADLIKPGRVLEVLKGLRSAEKEDDGKYHAAVHQRMLESYKIALLASESLDVWQEICGAEEWESFKQRPKHDDQKDALRYVVRLYVGFDGPADTKRASKYYTAMNRWFLKRAAPDELQEVLTGPGGIEALAEAGKEAAVAPGFKAITFVVPERDAAVLLKMKCGRPFTLLGTASEISTDTITAVRLFEGITLSADRRRKTST